MSKETSEEAAKRLIPVKIRSTPFGSKFEWEPKKERKRFVQGANWQAERMYTKEEVTTLASYSFNVGRRLERDAVEKGFVFEDWLQNQLKK